MRKLDIISFTTFGVMLSVAISACSFKPTEGDAKKVIEGGHISAGYYVGYKFKIKEAL